MPIAPPARVMVISELSTVAGASFVAPACPWPRASKPTQSTPQSTSGSPRICAIWSPTEASFETSTVSQPKLFACARRSGIRSPTMTTAAPSSCAPAAAARPTGPRAGDINRRARSDTRRDAAVIAGREDIGKAGETRDLRHGLRLVRELQQVQVGVGNHDVFRLAADPAAHIDVAVSRARPRRIHVQADAGLAFLAVPAAAAGNVERHGAEIADFDELHVAPRFDHFAGDFMAENQAMRRGRAPAHHVLIASADIRGNDLQNHAVLAFAISEGQLGKVDALNLDLARAHVCQTTIACHYVSFLDLNLPFQLEIYQKAAAPASATA